MRRTSLALVVFLLGLLAAAPALAQGRDPFDPQPGSGGRDTSTGDTSSDRDPFNPDANETQPAAQETPDPTEQPTATPPSTTPAAPTEGEGTLANTGFDVSTWSAIAYLLIVFGGAAIVAARTFGPVVRRRR